MPRSGRATIREQRVVKSVTEMSCKSYSHGQRDGAVRLQQASRLAYEIESRQDLANMTGGKKTRRSNTEGQGKGYVDVFIYVMDIFHMCSELNAQGALRPVCVCGGGGPNT